MNALMEMRKDADKKVGELNTKLQQVMGQRSQNQRLIQELTKRAPDIMEENKQVKEIRNGVEEFDGVAEIWIDDIETFTTKWKTGEGKEAFESFLEDEKNFVDWERSVCFLAEEKVVLGGK